MKICYVNPTFLIRRPTADLIGELGDDNDVGIFVPKKPFRKLSPKWHSDKSLSKAKIHTYSAVNIPFINFEWPIPITPMFLIHLFKIFSKYDTIHMWTYFYINSFWTLFISLFYPKKRVIMSCDTFPTYSFNPGILTSWFFRIYTILFGWFLFKVPDKIHIYGESLIKHAKKIGIKESKLVVISTGINLSKFSAAKPTPRKNLGVKKNDFVILYAGLIVPRKGIDIMLKVTKKLVNKNKNIKLLLVGEGPSKKKYLDLVKQLGLENNVIFLGWRKDIPSILKSVDCLILPSKGEGLPGVIMEAMASGLPVVASNIPCIPDLVENGKNGYLCGMNNVDCFTKKIKEVMKTGAKKMGKEGLKKINNLSWNKLISKYKQMYKY